MNSKKKDLYFQTTRRAVIWTSLLNEPLQVLYSSFLAVILYRDLGASPFQIASLMMLRPLISIVSLYWSKAIGKRSERLVTNVMITGILARVPFFFFPFTNNPWFIIASSTSYMMLSRGGLPAWIEVMKQNLPEGKRSKIFSYSTALGYVEGLLLSLAIGALLDNDHTSWKWLFPVSSAIGLIGLTFKAFIPEKTAVEALSKKEQTTKTHCLKDLFISPWRESLQLVRERPDFARFQWGFMFAGAAVMVMQPALPLFFVDYLHITYLDLAIALSLCKGLGFALTSPLWTRLLNTTHIFETSKQMCFILALFPLSLSLALFNPFFLYFAYFLYGIGQSGSHLVWHLSGASFSESKESHPFSDVNVLTVGLRGAIAPPIGSALTLLFGPIAVFGLGFILCLVAKDLFFDLQTVTIPEKTPARQRDPLAST